MKESTKSKTETKKEAKKTSKKKSENSSKKFDLKKIDKRVIGFGILVVAVIVVIIGLNFLFNKMTAKEYVCESDSANITLYYTKKSVTGYTATGVKYDLGVQKKLSKEKGVDLYLEEFNEWFARNMHGSCERKE